MLTEIDLDKERFEELAEQAKNMIASYCPDWTDFNYHDPGITISELFVLMKEVAQYRMNYVGEAHQLKYLKLLGLHRETPQPASVRVRLDCPQTMELPAFTRFFASGICFESTESKYLTAGDIAGCIYLTGGREIVLNRDLLRFTKSLKIPPFGRTPLEGERFYILLDDALPMDMDLSLFIEIYEQYAVARNPIQDNIPFYSIAKLSMGYYTKDGWKFCSDFVDGTYGFLQSGWMRFRVEHPMQKMEMAGQEAYFLCIQLEQSMYDVPCPILTNIGMNLVETKQMRHHAICYDIACTQEDGRAHGRVEANHVTLDNLTVLVYEDGGYRLQEDCILTRQGRWLHLSIGSGADGQLPAAVRVLAWELLFGADQILGEGKGLPYQSYPLPDNSFLPDELQLMIEEPGQEGLLQEWKQVEDFSCSGPQDRHYVVDVRKKTVQFGDCIHGMAPEGRIFITQYVTSEGSCGNIKAEKIQQMEEGYESMSPMNEDNAVGGRDLESIEDCLLRAKHMLHQNEGLVTDADYEQAVRTTPGLMIENCRVVHHHVGAGEQERSNRITIVVKPFSQKPNPKLSQGYIKNIQMWLEQRRMVGTQLKLMSPEYLKLQVFVECRGRSGYLSGHEAVMQALERYFAPFMSNFGGVLSQSELYEYLDRLDAVASMEALSIDVVGSRVSRTRGGDILLPPNGLISPQDIQYHISIN